MGKKLAVSIMLILAGIVGAYAQEHEHMDHHVHTLAASVDGRQEVVFPPEMRTHTLANMRDHLQSLSNIMEAMSKGQYAEASRIADTHLGVESPSAEGCKAKDAGTMPQMSMPDDNMNHQMAKYMPEGMRKAGLRMHESANEFSVEVAKVEKTGDVKPALAALSRVTQNCMACHAAYKLQ